MSAIFSHFGEILLVIGLFALGLTSPGPNLLVIARSCLAEGRLAGLVTGMGVVCGDGLYAAAGLGGLSAFLAHATLWFSLLKVMGGVYLAWLGIHLVRHRTAVSALNAGSTEKHREAATISPALRRHFSRGLTTCLSNPKTVLFFSSIFTVGLQPATPWGVRLAMLIGIIATSLVWRIVISYLFSVPVLTIRYRRHRRQGECVAGMLLIVFGLVLALP